MGQDNAERELPSASVKDNGAWTERTLEDQYMTDIVAVETFGCLSVTDCNG